MKTNDDTVIKALRDYVKTLNWHRGNVTDERLFKDITTKMKHVEDLISELEKSK